VPGLGIEADRALLQDVEDLADLLLADDLTQANRIRIGDGHHDLAVRVENTKDVKPLRAPGDVFLVDADNFSNTLGGIDSLVADLEFNFLACLHDVSLLATAGALRFRKRAGGTAVTDFFDSHPLLRAVPGTEGRRLH